MPCPAPLGDKSQSPPNPVVPPAILQVVEAPPCATTSIQTPPEMLPLVVDTLSPGAVKPGPEKSSVMIVEPVRAVVHSVRSVNTIIVASAEATPSDRMARARSTLATFTMCVPPLTSWYGVQTDVSNTQEPM